MIFLKQLVSGLWLAGWYECGTLMCFNCVWTTTEFFGSLERDTVHHNTHKFNIFIVGFDLNLKIPIYPLSFAPFLHKHWKYLINLLLLAELNNPLKYILRTPQHSLCSTMLEEKICSLSFTVITNCVHSEHALSL